MDNQQERLVSKDFVGGIITGEGWFGLPASANRCLRLRNGFYIMPRFCVQMNDEATILAVAEAFKSWGIAFRISRPPRAPKSLRLECAGMKRVGRLIDCIEPHLHGKKREAATLVRQFISSRQSKPMRSPYSDEEFAIANKLRFEVNDGRLKRKLKSSETTRQTSRPEPEKMI